MTHKTNSCFKKKKIFSNFAKIMNNKKINWCVVGGLEDFPNSIGRDLDIIIEKEMKHTLVINIFLSILKKNKITNIIIKKNQFYGHVVIGYDSNFNYLELHINPNIIRSLFFSITTNWKHKFIKIDNYLIDPVSYAFKNYFVANKKNENFYNFYRNKKLPYWLITFYKYKIKNKDYKINFFIFFYISILFMLKNPFYFVRNLSLFLVRRYQLIVYKHSHIFFLKNKTIKKHVLNFIEKNMINYFRDTMNVDINNIYTIKKNCFSFFYTLNKKTPNTILIDTTNKKKIFKIILASLNNNTNIRI